MALCTYMQKQIGLGTALAANCGMLKRPHGGSENPARNFEFMSETVIFPACFEQEVMSRTMCSSVKSRNNGSGGHHCLASMDSDFEAFSGNPRDGSFALLAFQLATFTKYPNEAFLSY